MPQSLFTFENDGNVAPQPAGHPVDSTVSIQEQLAQVQDQLKQITSSSSATPEQRTKANNLAIDFDPTKFQNTDPDVVNELKTNLVDKLNDRLGSLDLDSALDPKLGEINNKLSALTDGLQQLTERDLQREQISARTAFQRALAAEVPDFDKTLKDSGFQEFLNSPIEEGSSLTVGNIVRAAETKGDVGTIAAYFKKYRAHKQAQSGDKPPVTIPTHAQGGTPSQSTTTVGTISSLREQIRRGGDRKKIAEQVRDIKLF